MIYGSQYKVSSFVISVTTSRYSAAEGGGKTYLVTLLVTRK
jgi:hypothetical protein